MKRTANYKCRVKLRPSFKGCTLKAEARPLKGLTLILQYAWTFEEDEFYAGEYAMMSTELKEIAGIEWIASGDLESIEEIK